MRKMLVLQMATLVAFLLGATVVDSFLSTNLRIAQPAPTKWITTNRSNIAPALQVRPETTHAHIPQVQYIPQKKLSIGKIAAFPGKCKQKVDNFFQTQVPMLKYLWPEDSPKLKFFLVSSMIFMVLGKWFNTKVPFLLQRAVDGIPATIGTGNAFKQNAMPVALAILAYGLSRAAAVFCEELKTCLFTNVSQNVLRKFAYQIFTHLHTLGTDFHLQTPSGVISVAYVRAVRGFQALMFQLVFSVAPTALELGMVANILYRKFSPTFAAITLTTFASYILFTVFITQWRVALRKEIVEVDNTRNGFFIDSLLNQEVVKLFNNEKQEIRRFDGYLARMERLNIQSTYAVALLNLGQAVLFCAGLTTSLLVGLGKVQRGEMSVGDLVAVNSMLLQLAIPFDFIGYTYQELRQSLVDMGYMNQVLNEHAPATPDRSHSGALDTVVVGSEVGSEGSGEVSSGMSSGELSGVGSEVSSGSVSGAVLNDVSTSTLGLHPASLTVPLVVGGSGGSRSSADSIGSVDSTYTSAIDATTTAHTTHATITPTHAATPRPASTVEFRNVTFSYRKSKSGILKTATQLSDLSEDASDGGVLNKDYSAQMRDSKEVLLDNISFSIGAGENVAIVGPSGSGKSTTLKLITRMLEVDSGSILVDGADISRVAKDSVRERVAVVPQDNCLFDDTVGYNIKYGSAGATDEEVAEVVQQSNLVDTLSKFPLGLDTPVGERGARLSGGERQKVSIARALLRRPSLLLCDEVTSSVDALAEREIIETLRKCSGSHLKKREKRGGGGGGSSSDGEKSGEESAVSQSGPMRTTITVAHRLSSVAHCDKILVLQKGRVVEQGTHAQLMRIPEGVYRNMWNIQNHVVNEKNSVDGLYAGDQ